MIGIIILKSRDFTLGAAISNVESALNVVEEDIENTKQDKFKAVKQIEKN